ncbi:MAG: outer membrane beta-barrel protein [Flavitalea sp.]
MIKSLLLILVTFIFTIQAYTQNAIKGSLIDFETHSRIRGATIFLKSGTDTLFSRSSITDSVGHFIFSGLVAGVYKFSLSYVGYKNLLRSVNLDSAPIDLGVLELMRDTGVLEGVTITAKTPIATQKGDTIQINATEFKVNPDATIEDLAKKMPGITVEDGQVKANGENVQKVTLDGRDLFGDDATAALRNLPAEIVDKIQIFDRLSDQAQFTGYDDGSATKSINIVTKANMRNGQFGRVFSGYGTDGRYQAGGNTTLLKGNRKISFVGNFNNTNQQNFASQDLLGVTSTSQNRGGQGGQGQRGGGGGGGGRPGGGGGGNSSNFLVGQQSGINRTTGAGINYADNWGSKLMVSGSYFYNNTNNNTNESVNRQYVLDGIPDYSQTSSSTGANINHRVNMRIEYKIDSANQIIFTPILSLQNNHSVTDISTGFFNPASSSLTSRTENINNGKREASNFASNFLYRHSFRKKGRTFSINIQSGYNNKTGNVYTSLFDTTFNGGSYTDSTSQRLTNQLSNGYQLSANMVFTEPITSKSQLQVNYSPSYNKSKADQEAYQYDESIDKFSTFDPNLSSKFNNSTTGQNAGIGYRYGTKDNQLNIGANYQRSDLNSDQQFPRTLMVDKSFNNILPNAMLRLKLNSLSNIRFMYRVSTTQPSVTQLQDVYDYTNLPFVTAGNPDLRQQLSSVLSARYTYNNPEASILFVGNVFLQSASNYITNATFVPLKDSSLTTDLILKAGQQLTKPVNLNGYTSIRSFFTFAIPLAFMKSNLNLNGGVTYSKLPGIINNINNSSKNLTYSSGMVIASNVSQYVDFTLSYSANVSTVKNDLQPTLNNHYFSHVAGLQFNLLSKKGWFIQNNLTNQLYTGLSQGYNQSYFLWNMSAGKKIFKKQQGELKASVFDLLKQNRSIVRTVTETYIEDAENQVLRQYFMLTFSYNLRTFGTGGRGGMKRSSGMGNQNGRQIP